MYCINCDSNNQVAVNWYVTSNDFYCAFRGKTIMHYN